VDESIVELASIAPQPTGKHGAAGGRGFTGSCLRGRFHLLRRDLICVS
jgi:hypothetical protein